MILLLILVLFFINSLYEILISCIADRTIYSFALSNSSFTECARKCSSPSNDIRYQTGTTIIIDADHHHFENTTGTVNNNTHISPGHLTLSNSATFTSCIWRQCEAQNGGGIYLNVSNSAVSLTVTKSEFHSCKADPYRGGGIYLEGIGKVKIIETLFHECTCKATNDAGGGGIEMWNIQKSPTIERADFISCESGNDGGGLGIWKSPVYQDTCVKGCCFVECKSSNATSSDGGGLMVWNSSAAICCSDTLFSHSHSDYRGGAASVFAYNNTQFSSSLPLFSFSFFTDNTASYGNDLFLVEWTPTYPFFHSFSTTGVSKVRYVSNGNDRWTERFWDDKNDWLPQGIVADPLLSSCTAFPEHQHITLYGYHLFFY